MSWGAVIVGVGAITGGIIASRNSGDAADAQAEASRYSTDAQVIAADRAAQAQLQAAGLSAGAMTRSAKISADAAKYAADIQWQMYEQSRQDQLPWLKAGQKALGALEKKVYAGPGEFTESPGYQFRLDQGNKNILANQSATGNLASGRTLKAIQQYGQDYASNEYSNFLNQYYQSLSPLQSLAGLGQSTATSMGGQAIGAGNAIAGTVMTGAGQQASAYHGLAGIYGNMGSNLASIYMGQGAAIAQNYMTQGDISAANSIRQASIWNNAITGATSSIGYFMGQNSPWSGSPGAAATYSNPMTQYQFGTGYTGSYSLGATTN